MDIKNWKERFRNEFTYDGNGRWSKHIDGYYDEEENFIEHPHTAYAVPEFIEFFIDQLLQESIREELDKIYGQVDSDRSRFVIDIARKKYSPQEDKQ